MEGVLFKIREVMKKDGAIYVQQSKLNIRGRNIQSCVALCDGEAILIKSGIVIIGDNFYSCDCLAESKQAKLLDIQLSRVHKSYGLNKGASLFLYDCFSLGMINMILSENDVSGGFGVIYIENQECESSYLMNNITGCKNRARIPKLGG
jgi:hypothetical protein